MVEQPPTERMEMKVPMQLRVESVFYDGRWIGIAAAFNEIEL